MAVEDDFGAVEAILISRNEEFQDGDYIICQRLYELHKDGVTSRSEEDDIQCQRILRFSSAWWGSDPKMAFEGKGKTMKLAKFRQTLVLKTMEWFNLRDAMMELNDKIEGSGIFVFQHKTIPCFRFVGQSGFIVNSIQSLVLGALSGTAEFSPIISALLCSQAREWNFYFNDHADLDMLDNYENEAIFEHNTLWPAGLNLKMHLTATTLPDFRRLCLKHSWPRSCENSKISPPGSAKSVEVSEQKPIPLEDLSYTMFKSFMIDLRDKTLERFDDEVRSFHDVVKTLKCRFNSFQDEDYVNLDYACALYKEMIDRRNNGRTLAIQKDLCLKSGWWGLNVDTAIYPFNEKFFRLPMLMNTLAEKSAHWHCGDETVESLRMKMQDGGVFVFQHKTLPHFRYVGQSDNVLGTVRVLIHCSLVARCDLHALAAMLLCTRADDWYFYFLSVDDPVARDIRQNDLILKHDSLWPNGINRELIMNELTLSSFQASCVRHKWPKQRDNDEIHPVPSLIASDDDLKALSETTADFEETLNDLAEEEEEDDEEGEEGGSSSQPRTPTPTSTWRPTEPPSSARKPHVTQEFEERQPTPYPSEEILRQINAAYAS